MAGLKDRLVFAILHRINPAPFLRTCFYRALGMDIGTGTWLPPIRTIWPHQVRLGSNCRLEPGVYFHFDGVWKPGPSIVVGDFCFLGTGCEFNVRDGVRLGNHCLVAAGSRFVDHDHNISGIGPLRKGGGPHAPIFIRDHVWIGANAVVLKGVEIGTGAVVAAGAVVVKNIPPNEIWGGVPARRIGQRKDDCGMPVSAPGN
jgi:acetyltransferase-like isoleucine patch superfamily enzyme